MSIEVIMLGLVIVSTLVGLTTEAIKKLLDDYGKSYHANMLAGCVSIVISVIVGVAYMILTETSVNAQMGIYLLGLVFLSWLCSMVGYDKVIQSISQIKGE